MHISNLFDQPEDNDPIETELSKAVAKLLDEIQIADVKFTIMYKNFTQYWDAKKEVLQKLGVTKDVAKMIWQDVEAVMKDLMDDTKQPSEPQKDAPTPKKKAAKKSNKHPKKQYPKGEARAKLTDDNLKFIAKNWQKISINKMALKFGVSRFVVGHHVRKLKKAIKTN
jgi:hypothetical protein